jgi:hypothetical protein
MPNEQQALDAAGQGSAEEALSSAVNAETGAATMPSIMGAVGRGIKNVADRYNAMPSWMERAQGVARDAEGKTPTEMVRDPRTTEIAAGMVGPAGASSRSVGRALLPALDPALRRATLVLKQRYGSFDGAENFMFKMIAGDKIQPLDITQVNPKKLWVSMVGSNYVSGPNTFGVRELRDILEQLKVKFPEAEELSGFRVSGVRGNFGKSANATIKLNDPSKLSDKEILYFFSNANAIGEGAHGDQTNQNP